MTHVIVDDGQQLWVADRLALIEALNDLGWEKTRRLIFSARVAPETEDHNDDDTDPYTLLCERVPALDIEPSDTMPRLAWYPAENAWLWDRP